MAFGQKLERHMETLANEISEQIETMRKAVASSNPDVRESAAIFAEIVADRAIEGADRLQCWVDEDGPIAALLGIDLTPVLEVISLLESAKADSAAAQ